MTAGLGDEAIVVTHVRGHAGDIWKELVDHVAKIEAAKGHHLARQNIDLRLFGPVLPYFLDVTGQNKRYATIHHTWL